MTQNEQPPIPNRYAWEPTIGGSGRYRDSQTGRFVKGSVVRKELDVYLDRSDNAAVDISKSLKEGNISLADWEVGMMRQIKIAHMNAAATAAGGYANMTNADRGRAGAYIREQYKYLHQFAADIASGKQKLDGRLLYRAKMYIQAGRGTMYKVKQGLLKAAGKIDMVRSIRHARDSCTECINFAGVWFRLDDPNYKPPGDRICSKNCRCSEEYKSSTDDTITEVL